MTLQNEPTHIHGPENSKSKNVGSVGELTECTYTYTASEILCPKAQVVQMSLQDVPTHMHGPEISKSKSVGSVG